MDRLIYKWQLGRKNSIDLSEGIMLPTLDIVDFHAEEGVEYLVTGKELVLFPFCLCFRSQMAPS